MAIESLSSSRSTALRGVERRCPHVLVESLLGPELVQQLLHFVEEQRESFRPATVYSREAHENRLNLEARNCLRLNDVGPFKATLKQAVEEVLPAATKLLGILGPTPKPRELEMCAYGNSASVGPHIDTSSAGPRRVVSCVYYFFHQPAGFSGGALRLFAWPNVAEPQIGARSTVDFVPQCDSMIIFPSALHHEVRPIVCPSGDWRDYRFSINCWAHWPKTPAPRPPT
jgi:SM-20-related protein